jgi:DnaK suppressor protein
MAYDDGAAMAPHPVYGERDFPMATVLKSSGRKPSGKSGKGGSDTDAGNAGGDYQPSDDEPFMSGRQLEYFRGRLQAWKEEILRESQDTLNTLQKEPLREPDISDRASSETDWSIELRTRDRQRKLISKIDAALRRIDEGEYGYCEVSGEPISLARLEARPIATMTVDAQERHERQEKISRDE